MNFLIGIVFLGLLILILLLLFLLDLEGHEEEQGFHKNERR